MKSAGYEIREIDPFAEKQSFTLNARKTSPHANRIRLMWHQMRNTAITNFPTSKDLPTDIEEYLKRGSRYIMQMMQIILYLLKDIELLKN